MILVPGVPLINAIDDLAHGHAGIGLARLATGTVTILAIGFGLFFAASLAGDALPVAAGGGRLPVPEDALVSGLAAIGYGLLFGVPPRALPACVICGIAGHGGRTALAVTGLDLAAATLAASALVGLLATGLAERLSLPWTTFAFPGVVAMIPGSYAFRAATGALAVMEQGAAAPPGLVAETLGLAVAAMVMTAAVGSGLLLAVSARRLLGNRRRHAPGEGIMPAYDPPNPASGIHRIRRLPESPSIGCSRSEEQTVQIHADRHKTGRACNAETS